MDVQTADPSKITSLTRQGSRTDQSVIDGALRLWIEYGRSWKKTSDATGIPESTLRLWGDREQWETKRAAFASTAGPGMFNETAFSLKLAAHNAGKRLQQIAYDAAEHGIKPDRGEVDALTRIVDRGGHSPISKPQQVTETVAPHAIDQGELRNLSPDDLMQREQAARSRSRRQP